MHISCFRNQYSFPVKSSRLVFAFGPESGNYAPGLDPIEDIAVKEGMKGEPNVVDVGTEKAYTKEGRNIIRGQAILVALKYPTDTYAEDLRDYVQRSRLAEVGLPDPGTQQIEDPVVIAGELKSKLEKFRADKVVEGKWKAPDLLTLENANLRVPKYRNYVRAKAEGFLKKYSTVQSYLAAHPSGNEAELTIRYHAVRDKLQTSRGTEMGFLKKDATGNEINVLDETTALQQALLAVGEK